MKVKLICRSCGSDDIVSDAYARWNVQTQNWDLSAILDNKICENCEYEKNYCDEIPVEEEDKEMKPKDRIKGLLAANNLLVENNRLLKEQLRRDRDQFAFYSKEHQAKAEGFRHKANFKQNPERENLLENADASTKKASINEGFVVDITTVLDATSPRQSNEEDWGSTNSLTESKCNIRVRVPIDWNKIQ